MCAGGYVMPGVYKFGHAQTHADVGHCSFAEVKKGGAFAFTLTNI